MPLDDFIALQNINFTMTGKIALCRYGNNFRGLKAMIAQLFHVVGVLIYSDPLDDGFSLGPVYPDGPFRPLDAVQRGSADFTSIYNGDPLSPGVPARGDYPRKYNTSTAPVLPSIPIQPLSARDALPLLQALAGPTVAALHLTATGKAHSTSHTESVSSQRMCAQSMSASTTS